MYREHQADATLQMVGEAPKTIVTEPLEATTETAADSAETPKGGHSDIQALLVAEDLTKYYTVNRGLFRGKGSVKALNGISFTLEKGRTLAVVGESGCGKSTLAKVLTMIETPTGGALLYKGESLLARSAEVESIRRQKIQIIFQNPYGSLNPRKKIGKILEEPLLINTDLSADERKSRVLAMMEKVGLRTEFYDRYPHMFSGGQRQRIAIARGLMLNPDIVIADEPVSALDVSVQAQVLNLMMDLQAELGLSYLFISHDLSVVEHIADDVMVMYLGKTVEKASNEAIFRYPLHPYTQALLSVTPRLNSENKREKITLQGELPSPLNPPEGCAFNTRCPFVMTKCRQAQPALKRYLDPDGHPHEVACFKLDDLSEAQAN
ncbi:peptide ABC transporter ATP-binding protein [Ignatzschineria larvae DSM 13226]|uniref:Peptide ABC transporter ATP-binding protein n=2 Tax=Ignatzschineria larvae TaxID=112009 RepID=A0ABZ3BYI8_9GAMM|nr:peptide ABC transporter ATP-binding protein [Ignatzschineria larvae]